MWLLVLLVLAVYGDRGFSPDMKSFVESKNEIICGGRSIEKTQLNDNYCDCEDGRDEPGTSACSHLNVSFYCKNQGFVSKYIHTSTVDDGICDCCDGTDEQYSVCKDTCAHFAAIERKRKSDLLEGYLKGAEIRKQQLKDSVLKMQQAEHTVQDKEVELNNAKAEMEKINNVVANEEKLETAEKLEKNRVQMLDAASKIGIEPLSKEQLMTMLLDIVRTMNDKKQALDIIRNVRNAMSLGDSALDLAIQEYESKKSEQLAKEQEDLEKDELKSDEQEMVDDDFGPIPDIGGPLDEFFDELASTEYARPEAKSARDQQRRLEKHVQETSNTLETMKSDLTRNYGQDNEYYALKDTCISTKSGSYVYEMCFYGTAKQDSVQLGSWGGLTNENNILTIKFENGAQCWNGPKRSLTVTATCGETSSLFDLDEPETCVYTAKATLPIACTDQVLSSI